MVSFVQNQHLKFVKNGREHCHSVSGTSGSLGLWQYEQGQHVRNKCLLCHEPSLFLLFFGKEQTWLHPEELKTWNKKSYLCCTTTDKTTIGSLQMEIVTHFLHFRANLHLHFRSPLTCQQSHQPFSYCRLNWGTMGQRGFLPNIPPKTHTYLREEPGLSPNCLWFWLTASE